MFTLEQIKQAHSKVKSWADFPAYVQELISMGVTAYDTFVADIHAEYTWSDGYAVTAQPVATPIAIADTVDKDIFAQDLKAHQQGKTDFAKFREDAARSGVFKRTMDMQTMTCTYYDKDNNSILAEKLPQ